MSSVTQLNFLKMLTITALNGVVLVCVNTAFGWEFGHRDVAILVGMAVGWCQRSVFV